MARAFAIYLMNRGGGDGVGRATSSSRVQRIPRWAQRGPEEDMQNDREQSNQGPVAPDHRPRDVGFGGLDWSRAWNDLMSRYRAQQILRNATANADPSRLPPGTLFPGGYSQGGYGGGGGSFGSW